MMKKCLLMALVVLLAMPCTLRAEEVVIQLMEVISMGTLPGEDPLDGFKISISRKLKSKCFHTKDNP